jgi:hypothetical protein
MVARSPDGSHFLGSASTMRDAERLLRQLPSIDDDQITRLTRLNPRIATGV